MGVRLNKEDMQLAGFLSYEHQRAIRRIYKQLL
jgi:hypothetical protein